MSKTFNEVRRYLKFYNFQCERICGLKQETRRVMCATANGKIYPDDLCEPETMPESVRDCESINATCEYLWYASQWSEVIFHIFILLVKNTIFLTFAQIFTVKYYLNRKTACYWKVRESPNLSDKSKYFLIITNDIPFLILVNDTLKSYKGYDEELILHNPVFLTLTNTFLLGCLLCGNDDSIIQYQLL